MRTTLDIDDDVIEEAKFLSRIKNQTLGRTISELARRGLVPEIEPRIEMRDGIPTIIHLPGALAVTPELVRSLMEDE